MTSSPCFMGLPIEIRFQIYHACFYRRGGLFYSHDSQKLGPKKTEEKLELSLISTCRAIAAEAQGLPFKFNTVTFTAGCSIENYSHAGDCSRTLYQLGSQRFKVLSYMRPAISKEIYDEITSRFPLFKPVLDAIKEHEPSDGEDNRKFLSKISRWGDVPFSAREAAALTCKLALQSREREVIAAVAKYRQDHLLIPPHDDPLRIFTLDHIPWDVPSKKKLRRIQAGLYEQPRIGMTDARGVVDDNGVWRSSSQHPRPYHFSAAAVAIQFLRQRSDDQIKCFRNVLLREDSKSVAFPACHARGLIPFCQQNPRIRIERRVSLFGNILEVPDGLYPSSSRYISELSKALAVWVVEAMDLGLAGMPPDTFRLVLDEDHSPDRVRNAFDRVFQRSLTWHLDLERVYESSDKDTTNFFEMTRNKMYILDGFPRAMEELFRNNGILRCSFSPGELGEDGRVPPSSIDTLNENSEETLEETWDEESWDGDAWEADTLGRDTCINIVDDLGFDGRRVLVSYTECIGEVFGHTEFPGILS